MGTLVGTDGVGKKDPVGWRARTMSREGAEWRKGFERRGGRLYRGIVLRWELSGWALFY